MSIKGRVTVVETSICINFLTSASGRTEINTLQFKIDLDNIEANKLQNFVERERGDSANFVQRDVQTYNTPFS